MQPNEIARQGSAANSASVLTTTLVTLACAFLLVTTAAVAVVMAITSDANRLEAARQRDRFEAAVESQMRLRRLRLDNLLATGELQTALGSARPQEAFRQAFARLSTRFLDFDGAYVVDPAGKVLAGVESHMPAGQAGYDGLKHFSRRLPGASAAASPPGAAGIAANFIHDGYETITLLVADLLTVKLSGDAEPMRLQIVGYRRVTASMLAKIALRYRVADIRMTRSAETNELARHAIKSPDGHDVAWIVWQPERPGNAMLGRYVWAIGAVAILFVLTFLYTISRLRQAAGQIVLREDEIARLAAFDELSMLPNRRSFDLRLDQELANLSRTGAGLAVALLDLDRFKAVNDTYGHNAGDELIRQMAARLGALMRAGDTLARFGGDEFGIIQTNLHQPADAAALGERILAAMAQPFHITGVQMSVGCSIGIALAPRDGRDRETLVRLADTALYQSKNSGRNRYSFFEEGMNRSLQLKRMVEEDLRRAIQQDELSLHYQPQVSIDGTKIVGVEALVRWHHPEHGMIPPSEFIAVAEERGLIMPLSDWVLRRACQEAGRWKDVRLSVNVSPVQFRHKSFVTDVIRIIDETGFDPAQLELELTEGVVVEDADAAENAMMDLRAHGIGLALDDFGTGYSSLIYLRRFAFDKIKIDRSFLEYMETTGESAILVHSIAHLGRALGLRVCAEGVETLEQQQFLQAIGCHELQGFLFSRPVPAERIDELLTLEAPFQVSEAA